jgi:hypothetical protein
MDDLFGENYTPINIAPIDNSTPINTSILPKTNSNSSPEIKYIWIVFVLFGIITLISFILSIISITNPVNIQTNVIMPDVFDGFTMQKTVTTDTAEVNGTTNVLNTHTAIGITSNIAIASNSLSIGQQSITEANIQSFVTNSIFLNLTLNTIKTFTIPALTNTSIFLDLSSFTSSNFAIVGSQTLFDFKSNHTALALANLPNGGYMITLNMTGPSSLNSTNTKLVPVLICYDDSIQEWVNFQPGLLSSIEFMENQIGLNYIWNVTYAFITTGAFATFPVFTNGTRLGFQIYVQYGTGQISSITWNISNLRLFITKIS